MRGRENRSVVPRSKVKKLKKKELSNVSIAADGSSKTDTKPWSLDLAMWLSFVNV